MATPPEGFEVNLTQEDVTRMYERFFQLPEGCLVEQADGSHLMRIQDEVLVYQAGVELPLVKMIPSPERRIKNLEHQASDTTKSMEKRLEAWDMAAKLKAAKKANESLKSEGARD